MTHATDRQPAQAGDVFYIDDATVTVIRVSRHPVDRWVDVAITQGRSRWSKRMPTGIPATWTRRVTR